ncbi:hypothetical protein ACWDAO_41060 [Streptomyces sp. NPDC001212]|uniref:hypothetical protein n=1 Tax=Streptomyces sp. CoT10 TaxID=2875762 RepID=UPI001CD74140|nr:hypothetical protein [Streptomyces sp. CoT10]
MRRDLARDVDSLTKALQGPTRDIGGDKVWVGKNARAWHRELEGRHKKLGEEVGKLLPNADAAIRNEPDKVPAAETRLYQKGVWPAGARTRTTSAPAPRRDGLGVPVH